MQEQGKVIPVDAVPAETVSVTVSSDCPDWSEFLAAGGATIYQEPRWGEVMRRSYGSRPYYLTARKSGQVVGVLTLVAQKSLLFGSHLCSVPYFDAAGIVASDDDARSALILEAAALRRKVGAAHAELRQMQSLGDSIPARTDKVTMWLDLPAEADALWKGFKAQVRNQVRKAEKAGMTAGQGGAEMLRDFHAIYVRNMRDLGSPPHSRRFFEDILATFPDAVRLFVVRRGEQAVAASLTLREKHTHHVPWAGSDWRFRRDCPNMLLYWSMLQEACRSGARRFDFGRSTRDSGTFTFKKQWGAHEVPLFWHYLIPEGEALPELRPDSPKYRLMVAAWKRLPLCLARTLGPCIIGKLP